MIISHFDNLKRLEREPSVISNRLSSSECEIRSLSLMNREELYNYHACNKFVNSRLQTTNLLSHKLRENQGRLENIATQFITVGNVGESINIHFKRYRVATETHECFLKLLRSAHLVKTCCRHLMHRDAIAVMNLYCGLKLASGESAWLLADFFSELSNSALALRVTIARMLHRWNPISESIRDTLRLRSVDATYATLPSQYKTFPQAHRVQFALRREGYLLYQSDGPADPWDCGDEPCYKLRISSRPQPWLETSSRFHAIFCLNKERHNNDARFDYDPGLLLASWLSRHLFGTSRAAKSAIVRFNWTCFQRLIEFSMNSNALLTHIGGMFSPILLEPSLIRTRYHRTLPSLYSCLKSQSSHLASQIGGFFQSRP